MKATQTTGGSKTGQIMTVPSTCDVCKNPTATIYDAAILISGRRIWAWTCPDCFAAHSGALGIGRGQEYKAVVETEPVDAHRESV